MKNLNDKIIEVRSAFVSFLKYFLYGTAIIIFTLFLTALVSDISSASKLDCSISSLGIKQLFDVYDTSIQLGTALLAITALILTLERMRQTRSQIESIDHNYRFNNFYKHKEEFIKDFSRNPLFINLTKDQNTTIDRVLSEIYQFYFYKSYDDFKPYLNQKSLSLMDQFYSKLNSSSLKNYLSSFNEITTEELTTISNTFSEHHHLISMFVKRCLESDSVANTHANLMGDEYNKFLSLCHIFYTCQIIIDIVSFANLPMEKYRISSFTLSFMNYLNKHNFQNPLYLFG
jgi:hypothetical protein